MHRKVEMDADTKTEVATDTGAVSHTYIDTGVVIMWLWKNY